MIRIDHISFDFAAQDEGFAHGLYADWDVFCHHCFEQVVEECLSSYDKPDMRYELEHIDLDLGNIPEETFYEEFPRRLRDELMKVLPLWNGQMQDNPQKTAMSRMENLLFYLEHGYPIMEWTDKTFSLTKETVWLLSQSVSIYIPCLNKIARLCLNNEYALRRLLWHTDNREMLFRLYATVLAASSESIQEKRRFLALLLEMKPDIPVRFVHETDNDADLHEMAALLDTHSVRQIMRTETEEHAEVNLPPYWHYLYEWLVKYYPFNGLAIFGGKSDFIHHLHHRLLTFIYKRNYSYYLSKQELTASFLLEVFGQGYYMDVLNAIYDLQPHREDGSPVYDGYFNMELYRIFLRLSLLRLPTVTKTSESVHEETRTSIPMDVEALTSLLKDTRKSDADKRMILAMMVKEQPDILIKWLQTEAVKDKTLVTAFASLTDDTMIERLLVFFSFTAAETKEQVKQYLETHGEKITWLRNLSGIRLAVAIRKAVSDWIAEGKTSRTDSPMTLLKRIHYEVTGSNDNMDNMEIERICYTLNIPENENITTGEKNKGKAYIHIVVAALSYPVLPEISKRRIVTRFWEAYKDDYPKAIRLLHGQGLLSDIVRLTNNYILDEIIYRSMSQVFGITKGLEMSPLLEWLFMYEASVLHELSHQGTGIRTSLLWWIAFKASEYTEKTTNGILQLLLIDLFAESHITSFIGQVVLNVASSTGETYESEAVLALLQNIESNRPDIFKSAFEGWRQNKKNRSNLVQTLFESHWNTAKGFMEWTAGNNLSDENNRVLLQEVIAEKPKEWILLLRKLPKESRTFTLIAEYVSSSSIIQGLEKMDFYQASVLSRTVEWFERYKDNYPFLAASGISLSSALTKSLLVYMQDEGTLGRTLTEQEIREKFLSSLFFVYTGKLNYVDKDEWRQLSVSITIGIDRNNANAKEPNELLMWLEQDADSNEIEKIAETTDIIALENRIVYLAKANDFESADSFVQLMTWLYSLSPNQFSVKDLALILFLWIKETDWRRQTPEQMENYFFSRLFKETTLSTVLPMERLVGHALPESMRKQLLHTAIRFRPKELLNYIRLSVSQHILSTSQWVEWIETDEWMRLAANLSLSMSDLIGQILKILHLNDTEKRYSLANYIITYQKENGWYNREELVCTFVQTVPALQSKSESEMKVIEQTIRTELNVSESEDDTTEAENAPEILLVDNAGLCLLSPWLVRLFSMLGYLEDKEKIFKDTTSKIRAVFLLQYLVHGEELEHRESELAFNRLLTALPSFVPLPKRLALTREEKQTADGMMTAVKAYWKKMDGTSMNGFRQSFILRDGILNQQEERWLLTVNDKAHDVLLETVPWSFRQIRLPWLKKYVQVAWHEKQEF